MAYVLAKHNLKEAEENLETTEDRLALAMGLLIDAKDAYEKIDAEAKLRKAAIKVDLCQILVERYESKLEAAEVAVQIAKDEVDSYKTNKATTYTVVRTFRNQEGDNK